MTATLHELRSDLVAARETHGRRSSQAERAFSNLCRAAADAGTPLDGLRHHTENEVERFFSWTIPGVDEHVYWDGPKAFVRNDKKARTPLRYWWQHRYGNLANSDDLVVKCGERNCINPEHAAKERRRGYMLRYTDSEIFGSLQVLAERLEKTPSSADWKKSGRRPHASSIEERYGSWANAVSAAGLPPVVNVYLRVSPERVLAGIKFAKRTLGHWPSTAQYQALRVELRAAGHPTSSSIGVRIFGSWPKARQAAGAPENIWSEGQKRRFARREVPPREDAQTREGSVN